MHQVRGWIAIALACATVAVLGACSSYSRQAPAIRDALAVNDYERAIKEVDKIDRSGSELLYCYEMGLVLHEQGDYAASNAVFERADQVLEELYTRSISREIGALTVSETLGKYRGDAFEAVLVNYYKILNYLFLGEIEDALVECRRLNQKLQRIHDAGETYFADDPFLQYLTGLVYERGDEPGSAEVSYRAALEGYRADSALAPPPWLPCDAADNARAQGDAALAARYAKDAACETANGVRGRVAVMIETGIVARKLETSFTVPIFNNDRYSSQDDYCHQLYARRGVHYENTKLVKYWLRVALPVLQADPRTGHRAVVRASRLSDRATDRAGQEAEVTAVQVEDLDGQAARAFREKEATIVLRAIARALTKYLATDVANNKNEGLGTLVNLLGVVTETADTRSWTTLPGSIELARLDLEPGTYRIDVDVVDPRGLLLVHRSFDDVRVRPNGFEVRRVRLR